MFRFKKFDIIDEVSAMKIGTDGVLLGAWAFDGCECNHVVDAGCGTGLISLMLAQRFPLSSIVGVEIESNAAFEACHNVDMSPWSDRVRIKNIDYTDYIPDCGVDAIVSNPPFFTDGILSPSSSRALARHGGSGTLVNFVRHSASILGVGGRFALIAPPVNVDSIIYEAAMVHLDVARLAYVYARDGSREPVRVMIEFKKGLTDSYIEERLCIRTHNGQAYTDSYRKLTQQFYLEF